MDQSLKRILNLPDIQSPLKEKTLSTSISTSNYYFHLIYEQTSKSATVKEHKKKQNKNAFESCLDCVVWGVHKILPLTLKRQNLNRNLV